MRGFTLVELMIVVCIIGLLAAIAIPQFDKYMFDAWEVEAVRTLSEARRDQERIREQNVASTGQDVYSEDMRQFYYQVPSSKFNLVVGATLRWDNSVACPGWPGFVSYADLGLYPYCPTNLAGFGFTSAQKQFLMLVEGYYSGSNNLHVIGMDQNSAIFLICDAWTGEMSPDGSTRYATFMGAVPQCVGERIFATAGSGTSSPTPF